MTIAGEEEYAFEIHAFGGYMYMEDNKTSNTTNDILEHGDIYKMELNDDLLQETERIWAEVQSDESIQDVTAPSDMRENILKAIREKETKKSVDTPKDNLEAGLSEEQRELIYLGMVYKKKRKLKKYLLLVAALVMMFALGITSTGAGEKIFDEMVRLVGGREQKHIDSDNIVPITEITEEDVYQQIEDQYGVVPVRMMYYPEGIALQEVVNGEDVQGISMYYGTKDNIYIVYFVRPNFQNGSWGQDIEDELVEEYEVDKDGNKLKIIEYLLKDDTTRWYIRFEYQDISYSIMIQGYEKDEMEKIVDNLFFYK